MFKINSGVLMKIVILFTIILFQPIDAFGEKSTLNSSSESFEERIEEENNAESLKYSFLAHKPFYIFTSLIQFQPK